MKHEELAEQIIDSVKNGESVVLEAYPGFGKTRIASIILSKVNRGLVVVRTHNEIEEIFNFLSNTKGIIYAYGKPKLCFKLHNFSYRACRTMNVLGKCQLDFNNKDVAWLAAMFRKPEEIREYEKKHNRCLYRALRMLAHKTRRVVVTYDYIVSHPNIMENRDIVVFDEAHHLISYIDEVILEINSFYIDYLVKEMKKDIETRPLAYALKSIYKKSKSIHEFIEKITDLLAHIDVDGELIELLEKITHAYYTKKYYCENHDCYFLTDTLPKIARIENKVLIGAYLPPTLIMNTKQVKKIVVRGEPRIKAIIDKSLTTKYTERNDSLYKNVAMKIQEYLRDDCGNFIVFTSHRMKEEIMKYLPDRIKYRILKHDVRKLPKGSIIVDVAGGKLSEGVNIQGLGNVIVAGMPFPEPTPALNLLRKVYGFENTYTYIALLRTFQAIGRIRGSGTAYLLDKRFSNYKNMFPAWIEISEEV